MKNKNEIQTGEKHYRAFVGSHNYYDIVGADQFNLLTFKGLREHHKVLDIGCGSLRAGRLLIPYLARNNYYGIEPEKWLVEDGFEKNLGNDIKEIKSPSFNYNGDFKFDMFDTNFDYLIACSIFSHASQSQIMKCLSSASNVMHDNSFFFASFKQGETNYSADHWAYPEVITYRFEWMKKQANKYGLKCIKLDWISPHLQTWLLFSKSNDINEFNKHNFFEIYRKDRKN